METKVTLNNLQSQVEKFTEKLNTSLVELGILDNCQNLEIDHICIRLKDTANVQSLKKELEAIGQVISAVNVNGREIMIFQLIQPISLGKWRI